MEEILELAQKLGATLKNDSRFQALREAENKIEGDADARKLLDDFEAQTQKIMELERAMKPVEVGDKRHLREIHEKVAAHPLIKELVKARMEYADLMSRINRAIFGASTE